ncbi:hypothetical protein CALVIDRAFT_536221 [Calocera viscosa TUFC12733]|uniref:Uncharacterized protein n=1 Tax=Calocera viscosa (strain TUFC12733) TaxID=1330018 RepID=A0A167NF01_CALVF|nr:hypothetical protein CALVIDRAFT_536221 [Calocera viscosa TUFC12733]
MDRLKQLTSHFTSSESPLQKLERKSPDDIVITLAVRSPLCKAWKGALKDTRCALSPSPLLSPAPPADNAGVGATNS